MFSKVQTAWILGLCVAFALSSVGLPALAGPSANPVKGPPLLGPGANFDHQAYVEGARDAPGLLTQADVACTVEQAVFEGESSLLDGAGKTVGHARLYEVACSEGLGYQINVRGKAAPIAFDCISAGQTGRIACMLPLNSHPAGGLEPYMRAAGIPCGAVRARRIGEDDKAKLRRYEVTCGEMGYVLDIPLADGSGPAPKAIPCLQDEQECRLTNHIQNVTALAIRVGIRLGDECHISDGRYVGFVAARGHQLYEVSCQTGHDGELIEVDAEDKVTNSQACSKIKLVGAACQLKAGVVVDPKIADAQHAEAASPLGNGLSVITTPAWTRRPSAEEFGRVYPDMALRNGVSGRVVIGCEVTAIGTLVKCSVIDEAPANFGFGAATLKLAADFHMRPRTRDGQPVAGVKITIPIIFSIAH